MNIHISPYWAGLYAAFPEMVTGPNFKGKGLMASLHGYFSATLAIEKLKDK